MQDCSENGTSKFLNEPLLGFFLADLLEVTESSSLDLSSLHSLAWSSEDNVEVHTVNTSRGIILYTQVDVFINTKAEVSYIIIKLIQRKEKRPYFTFVREILLSEFVLLDLETSLEELLCFITSDSDMD